jgi:hypothetical protein
VKTILDQLTTLASKADALQPGPPPPAPVTAEQPRASITQSNPHPKKPPPSTFHTFWTNIGR